MIQGKWFPSGSDISCPLSIRHTVFGLAQDDRDLWAQQVVVYDMDDSPAGTARLAYDEGAFRMDLLGVLPEKRRQGFGDLLVRLCLFKALTHNASMVCLMAPEELVPFFARYGFEAEAHEEGRPVPMRILSTRIHLDHCNGHCDGCH